MKCGFKWVASVKLQNGEGTVPQTCALRKGHKGDHKSWSKIIAPNEEGVNNGR